MNKKCFRYFWILTAVLMLSSCGRESTYVSHNISKMADNFNVSRKVTVFNTRTDSILFEMSGVMSVTRSDGYLDITERVGDNTYKKHFIRLSDDTIYTIVDLEGSEVSNDKYQ